MSVLLSGFLLFLLWKQKSINPIEIQERAGQSNRYFDPAPVHPSKETNPGMNRPRLLPRVAAPGDAR